MILHRATATLKQAIPAKGVREIVFETAGMEEDVRVPRTWGDDPVVSVTARVAYSITGYHGSVEHAGPGPVEPRYLQFDVHRHGKKLVVTSREMRYIHHAVLVEELTVTIPHDVRVTFATRDVEEK